MSAELIALITTIIRLAAEYGPEIAQEGALALTLLQQKEPLTPEQIKQVEEALDSVGKKLDEALAQRIAQG